MNRRMALLSGASLLSGGCASVGPQASNRELVRVVTDAEVVHVHAPCVRPQGVPQAPRPGDIRLGLRR